MAFGMGQSCLQVTFQAEDLADSLRMYDGLLPFTPILLALTASTPSLRGYLVDTDVRWNILSQSVDDRTDEELGKAPLKPNNQLIHKSRYDSVSSYLSPASNGYSDTDLEVDPPSLKLLLDAGVAPELANHIAHLFIRDPLVVYKDKVKIDDKEYSDHFENLQSTNWQSLRFKPPPAPVGEKIGWRIEFRTMELQFTDFENAAYACLVCLLTHVIRELKPNFYMPISKIDENVQTAHIRDAVRQETFWFRKSLDNEDSSIAKLTINEIMNGSDKFLGVIPLVNKFLELKKDQISQEAFEKFSIYLQFIGARASGKLITNATWIRQFIRDHPSYQKNSIITHEIAYDLFVTLEKIQKREQKVPELYGDYY